MRIALVPSWYPTLDDPVRGHFFVRHAQALALEHEVIVISPSRGARLPAFTSEVFRRVRAERPDVVHAHVAVPAGVAALAARRAAHVPVVLTEHSGPLERLYRRSPLRRRAVVTVLERVDALAIPSSMLERELRALGIRRRPDVIPNPVPDRGRGEPEPFLFVAVGLMDDRTKGFDYLLRAWVRVAAARPEARLRIVGDGLLRREYAQLGAAVGAERVTFVGSVPPERAVEELRRADGFVSASVYETFGYALAEAAALGTPVVATTVGIAPDLVDDRGGILVPPADASALADALLSFCSRRCEFDREELRRRALEQLGPAAVCRRTTAVYEHALAARDT